MSEMVNITDKSKEKHIERAVKNLRDLGITCCPDHTVMIKAILRDLAEQCFEDGYNYRTAELN